MGRSFSFSCFAALEWTLSFHSLNCIPQMLSVQAHVMNHLEWDRMHGGYRKLSVMTTSGLLNSYSCHRSALVLFFPVLCFAPFLSCALLLSFPVLCFAPFLSFALLCFALLCSALLLSFLLLCFAFLCCALLCSFPFFCFALLLSFPVLSFASVPFSSRKNLPSPSCIQLHFNVSSVSCKMYCNLDQARYRDFLALL